MAPKRKLSSAQHQRRGTPSTVSSAEPPILQSSSSQGPIENSDDESSELNAEESSPVVRQDRPAPLKESANAPQHESSDSDYEIPIANLTPPSVNRRWAFPTQPSPLPVSPRPSGRVAPKPKARRRPFSRFKAYLNTRLPPSVVLDKRTRKELKMRPNIHTPTKPSQSFTEEQDASTIDQSEKAVLEQMAVTESRWVRPTIMTTEEEEMMREVTMKDLDEMFGDITFPASEEEIAARSEDDQAMSSDPLSSPPSVVASPPPSPSPARKRVRFTDDPPAEDSPAKVTPARQTRRMTTALVTAAPTLDTEVPKSWERACLADKRMSYMKDVEKGWAVITEMWNNETGAAKTVLQVSRRWGSIKGSIGRWTSFDAILRRAVAKGGPGRSPSAWAKIAAAVTKNAGFKVSGEECAGRFAALELEPPAQAGKGRR